MIKNLKRSSVIFILFMGLLLTPLKGKAQNISMGIYCDPLITWMNTNSSKNASEGLRPGYSFGFTFQRYFAPNYAISTGLSLINAGGRSSSDEPFMMLSNNSTWNVAAGDEVIYKLKYLSIPIGFKLQTNQIGYNTYFADFGLDTKFLISSSYDIPSLDVKNENGSKEVNHINMGWHITMGMEYSLGGSTALTAGIGFDDSFFDVTKDHANAGQAEDRSQLKIIRIRLGMIF